METEVKIDLVNGSRVVEYINYGMPRTVRDNVSGKKTGKFLPRQSQ